MPRSRMRRRPRSRRSRRPSRQPWPRAMPARRRSFSPRIHASACRASRACSAGRAAIEKFWATAVSGGLKTLTLAATETDGRGDLRVETGTYTALGANGAELSRGQYLLVWKREDGAWKIHRDFGHADGAMTAAGPSTDRVGFPADYGQKLRKVSDAVFNEKFGVSTVFTNELAASSPGFSQARYPNGSVIMMEFAKPASRRRGRAVARCARHAAQGRDRAHRRHAARRRLRCGVWREPRRRVGVRELSPRRQHADCRLTRPRIAPVVIATRAPTRISYSARARGRQLTELRCQSEVFGGGFFGAGFFTGGGRNNAGSTMDPLSETPQ